MIQTWTVHQTDDLDWIVKHNGNPVNKRFATHPDAMRSARRRAIGATKADGAVMTALDGGWKVESPGPMSNRRKMAHRQGELDQAAKAAGWDSWSHFGTAVKRREATIPNRKV